jgi:hypothetical protein
MRSQPRRVKLVALIFLDEFAAVDAGRIGQLHHARIDRHDPAVDAVKLVDQRLDPVVVQVKLVHQRHDFRTQLLIGGLVRGRKAGLFRKGRAHPRFLHLGQLDVVARDQVQRFQNLGLEGGLHRGQRHVRGLVVLVVILGAHQRVAVGVQLGLGAGAPCAARRGRDIDAFQIGAHQFVIAIQRPAKGGLQIDHVAQQDVFGQKFVAPDRDGLERQRAFAEARDHRVAPGLDPLGDGDLAFAAQQFDRTHLAQVHADRDHRCGPAFPTLPLKARSRASRRCRRVHRSGRIASISSSSVTWMPISDSIDITSSIWSDET